MLRTATWSPSLIAAYPDSQNPNSPLEFAIPGTSATLDFTLDGSGRGASVAYSTQPGTLYNRTGAPVHHLFHDYMRTEAMIPMRDGIKLHAIILKPADISAPLPFCCSALPTALMEPVALASLLQRPELARDGYIYVAEDIRGRYKSQGKFTMMRPLADHKNPKQSTNPPTPMTPSAWLLKNVSGNNGRVGVVGTSYPGFLAMMAGIDPHPAVKAISPQAPMIDVWLGDDFFHNGAFRQTYGYDYVLGMESSKELPTAATAKTSTAIPSTDTIFSCSAARLRRMLSSRTRPIAHMEIFSRSSRLRTVLELARRRVPSRQSRRAHAHCRRILRPGRYVGASGGVRKAGAARRGPRQFSRPRSLASRLLVFVLPPSGQPRLRRVHRQGVPRAHRGKILCALFERRARLRSCRIQPAFKPAPTPGSITRSFRPRPRSRPAFISPATAC